MSLSIQPYTGFGMQPQSPTDRHVAQNPLVAIQDKWLGKSDSAHEATPFRASPYPSYETSYYAEINQAQMQHQVSESMSVNLTTREGDEVTLDFKQLYAHYQSYQQTVAHQDEQSAQGRQVVLMSEESFSADHAFEQRLAFQVQGDLNEDEVAAIVDVFQQIDALANQFFDGNIEQAFAQAEEMNVDFSQLQRVQFDLQRSETVQVSTTQVKAYEAVQQYAQPFNEPKDALGLGDLPPYLQQMQAAIERLNEQFEAAHETFDQLMGGVVAQRFSHQDSPEAWMERVGDFHQRLRDAFDAGAID